MNTLIFSKIFAVLALCIATTSAEFINSCNVDKTIALTFDDGPHKYTKELVDYIADEIEEDVKITFFTVAEFHYPFATNVDEYQEAMKKAHDSGFQIASHTWGHKISPDMTEFKKNLERMDDFIEEVTGDRPKYFRAPKGNCEEECQSSLEKWGYNLIQWDTDTNDWDLATSGSIEQRVEDSISFLKKEFAKEKDNYLVLMHDSQNYTVREIVPWIIKKSGMIEKGYRFVSVAECLGDKSGMYASGKVVDDPKKPNVTEILPNNSTLLPDNSTVKTGDNDASLLVNSAAGITTQVVSMAMKGLIIAFLTIFYVYMA